MLRDLFIRFKSNWLLNWIRRLTLLMLLGQVAYFCYEQTDGFTIRKILSNLKFNPDFFTPLPSEEEMESLQTILNKKFYYLGKGAQVYAFVSEDEQYVIKFIRYPHVSINPILAHLPLPTFWKPYRDIKEVRMKERLYRHFSSFKIAYDHLKEETGIVYLHLNKTDYLQKKITIHDKLGIAHVLDADKIEFILQKKADLVYPNLANLMEQNKIEEAKLALDSLFSLFVKRCKQGIFDADPNIITNFGFIKNQAVQFDIGRFSLDPGEMKPEKYTEEILRVTGNFSDWLHKNYPELANYFDEKISSLSNEENSQDTR